MRFEYCYSKTGMFACREEEVGRLLMSAAWAAALVSVRERDDRSKAVALGDVGGGDLFELSNAVEKGEQEFDRLLTIWADEGNWTREELRAGLTIVKRIVAAESDASDKEAGSADVELELYRVVSGYVFSFVVGHELLHYAADRCMLSDSSELERTGEFERLLKLHGQNGLLCSLEPLLTTEVLADRCAYRTAATFDSALQRKKTSLPHWKIMLGRRLAVDILSWALAYGPGSPGRSSYTDDMRFLRAGTPGYMHNPLRVVGFARSIRGRDATTDGKEREIICEDSARVAVIQLNRILAFCAGADSRSEVVASVRNGQPMLVNELGVDLPGGVSEAWRTGVFVEESTFSCR
ncbi:hypothetical protein [Corallococcus sp. CA049B]|uniref:hypothetical protein n=1 Tax=Corallococcus sp. CA049B TaxID=2316730 RepID=UPI0011C499AD|nr:hypothetical protein [Corallococcus sp. CA049B]